MSKDTKQSPSAQIRLIKIHLIWIWETKIVWAATHGKLVFFLANLALAQPFTL